MSFKFNPLGPPFDLVDGDGSDSQQFSYIEIGPTETVTIPPGQQMLVRGPVRVLGHLIVQGDMVDVSGPRVEQFFYDLIGVDEVVQVYENRLLMFNQHLTVHGHLRVNGRLVEV